MYKHRTLPRQDRLHELFSYDPTKGHLLHKTSRGRASEGARACNSSDSYLNVSVDGVKYREHRIIWMFVYGQDPEALEIDHINGEKQDNRIANLRLANRVQQHLNRTATRKSRSGLRGVSWHSQHNRWYVRALDNGQNKSIGYYKTLLDAAAARIAYENNHPQSEYFR